MPKLLAASWDWASNHWHGALFFVTCLDTFWKPAEAMGFLTSLAIFSADGWLDITTNQIQGKDGCLSLSAHHVEEHIILQHFYEENTCIHLLVSKQCGCR